MAWHPIDIKSEYKGINSKEICDLIFAALHSDFTVSDQKKVVLK